MGSEPCLAWLLGADSAPSLLASSLAAFSPSLTLSRVLRCPATALQLPSSPPETAAMAQSNSNSCSLSAAGLTLGIWPNKESSRDGGSPKTGSSPDERHNNGSLTWLLHIIAPNLSTPYPSVICHRCIGPADALIHASCLLAWHSSTQASRCLAMKCLGYIVRSADSAMAGDKAHFVLRRSITDELTDGSCIGCPGLSGIASLSCICRRLPSFSLLLTSRGRLRLLSLPLLSCSRLRSLFFPLLLCGRLRASVLWPLLLLCLRLRASLLLPCSLCSVMACTKSKRVQRGLSCPCLLMVNVLAFYSRRSPHNGESALSACITASLKSGLSVQ